tara:strand:- start:692 stop:1135 length:444 start_codon:yes stop_codon:yes gene_type:complete
MLEASSLSQQKCQPIMAYCGKNALINLKSNNLNYFSHLNFKNLYSFFSYEIKICKFPSEIFSTDKDNYFAYLVQVYVESEDSFESPFSDANIFLEKDFEDLIEYSIILPRLFKKHHRYVVDLQLDSVCSFMQFGEKVNLWKKSNGLF